MRRLLERRRRILEKLPPLEDLGPDVRVLVRVDGEPVLVQQGSLLAATFHPELTPDLRVHGHLLSPVRRG